VSQPKRRMSVALTTSLNALRRTWRLGLRGKGGCVCVG
jgi:hypothetical protein